MEDLTFVTMSTSICSNFLIVFMTELQLHAVLNKVETLSFLSKCHYKIKITGTVNYKPIVQYHVLSTCCTLYCFSELASDIHFHKSFLHVFF